MCVRDVLLYHREHLILLGGIFFVVRFELHQHQINDICHHMKLKLRREILPSVKIDKDLIGGVKIKIDDFIYDYSIRAQLNKFKYNIIHS